MGSKREDAGRPMAFVGAGEMAGVADASSTARSRSRAQRGVRRSTTVAAVGARRTWT